MPRRAHPRGCSVGFVLEVLHSGCWRAQQLLLQHKRQPWTGTAWRPVLHSRSNSSAFAQSLQQLSVVAAEPAVSTLHFTLADHCQHKSLLAQPSCHWQLAESRFSKVGRAADAAACRLGHLRCAESLAQRPGSAEGDVSLSSGACGTVPSGRQTDDRMRRSPLPQARAP